MRRFLNIWSQTLAGPLVTAGLFLFIFTYAIGPSRGDVMGMPFVSFLAPGILMMTVIQNAFANTSSSLISAKVQGNIVDTLMPPLSPLEMVLGYLAGGIGRGVFIAFGIGLGMLAFLGIGIAHPVWALVFVFLGSALMGALGLLGGIIALKFDQMSAITNFVITPLAFLSGTFYSIESLPGWMQAITHWNPIFYLIDGLRFGVLGVSDSSPWLGLGVASTATLVTLFLCWRAFATGYRLKS
ncbi:UNVERIFIED_CONTAM: hypothetical protein GTU68_022190 [Idotea baltica]|nr:hypothetical protein [Idotea baltica]